MFEKRRREPSGDHCGSARPCSQLTSAQTARKPVPSAFMTAISPAVPVKCESMSVTNAIRRPSGDQAKP